MSQEKMRLPINWSALFFYQGKTAVVLDGCRLQAGLKPELGFDKADRDENLRRVVEMAKVPNDQGLIVILAFYMPRFRNQAGGNRNYWT